MLYSVSLQEVALLDVRKELSFCKKAEIEVTVTPLDSAATFVQLTLEYTDVFLLPQVLGLVENMCGVCCPACGQGIQLFAPNTGVSMTLSIFPYLGSVFFE